MLRSVYQKEINLNVYDKNTAVRFRQTTLMAAPPKARVFGRSLAGSNPAVGMAFSFECFVLSDKGLRDKPILRAEESYRVCVIECDLAQQ